MMLWIYSWAVQVFHLQLDKNIFTKKVYNEPRTNNDAWNERSDKSNIYMAVRLPSSSFLAFSYPWFPYPTSIPNDQLSVSNLCKREAYTNWRQQVAWLFWNVNKIKDRAGQVKSNKQKPGFGQNQMKMKIEERWNRTDITCAEH